MPLLDSYKNNQVEQSNQKIKLKKNIIILIAGVVILVIVVLIGLTASKLPSYNPFSSSSSHSTNIKIEFQQVGDIPKLFNKKLYFTDGNIFILNISDFSINKITNFPSSTYTISHLKVINENMIGYVKCNILVKIQDCSINSYNINTSKEINLKNIDKESTFIAIDFIDESSFVYSYKEISQDLKPEMKIIYNNKGEEKNIEVIQKEIYKRDELSDDTINLALSFDHQKVLFIDTFLNGLDNTVYIYNLESEEVDKIDNAVQPVWIDNNTILYRSVALGFFEVKNLITKNSSRVKNIQRDSFFSKSSGIKDYIYSRIRTRKSISI